MSRPPGIAVIGAGFTGTMTALQLLRHGPPSAQIYLVEKSAGFGRGLAFAAHNPGHLLNVRAANMSAFADEADHLVRWLAGRPEAAGGREGDAFITRGAYGDYLSGLLRGAIAGPEGAARLVLTPDEAVGLSFNGQEMELRLAMGRRLRLDAAVLALGNLPPRSPENVGLEMLGPGLYAADPWARSALEDIEPDAPILLLGSGLTMVDIVLDLGGRGHRGPLLALSRRGLTPQRHAPVGPPGPPPVAISRPLSHWVRATRARSAAVGWRLAIDELRPLTQDLWRAASMAERRRFLNHLRPWWDVARHRMAPVVADKIDSLSAKGQLQVRAGRLMAVAADGDRVLVRWRPRGGYQPTSMSFGRIINCTGSGADLTRTQDPLLVSLLEQGAIRADPLGLGLEIDAGCQTIDAAGRSARPVYAAGPITQGYAWEVTAVPDIRNQVSALSAHLTSRLSVLQAGG